MITTNKNNYVLPEYGDWFRPYPFLLFLGFLLTVGLIFLRAKRKKLPLIPFEKFLFICLPVGVLFASFFGKLDIKHPLPFYELFFFWQAGLSIHGAIIGGLFAALCFFPSQSRKYQISMWVWLDIIAPCVLIGQIIGRWGNFFNHEILGHQVSYESLKWLPDFIKNSCFRFDINSNILTPEINNFGIIYRQPLFLYEIFGNLILFILLMFIVPNLGKWFGNKPWKKIQFKNEFTSLTWKGKWNKAYYELEVNDNIANTSIINYKDIKIDKNWKFLQQFKYKIINKKEYFKFLLKKDVKSLNKLHNHYNIVVIRSGVNGSLFFFGYNFIRIFLEFQRQPQELFIKNLPNVSYTIIIVFMLLSLLSCIFAQFISPNKWRNVGWYYEKQY